MASPDSGFFEATVSRTRSIIRTSSILSGSIIKSHRSHSDAISPTRTARRTSRSPGPPVILHGPITPKQENHKITMPSFKSKSSKKPPKKRPGTILLAVPKGSSLSNAALANIERDMALLPNEEILANIARSGGASPTAGPPSSLRSYPSTIRGHSTRRRGPLSPIVAGEELKFPEVKGAIGLYKNGKIEWGSASKAASYIHRSSTSSKDRRPKIQLVIPSEDRDRPLPTSPFFGQAPFSRADNASTTHSRFVLTAVETSSVQDVSPPSGSKKVLERDSIVSPITSPQLQPIPHFQPLIASQTYHHDYTEESLASRNVPSRSPSSDESPEDDASSVYTKASSRSSIDAENPPLHPRMNFHERSASAAFSIKSPAQAGIFDDDVTRGTLKSEAQGSETGPRIISTMGSSPPRRYAPHPPIEQDVEFKPTCELRPSRNTSHPLQRKPTIYRRSSKRKIHRRSLSADYQMGVLNQAINRTASWQTARDAAASPTLSEAENELEQHLHSSFTDDNPFKWDDIVSRESSLDIESPAMPPALPRKSSKRDTSQTTTVFRLSNVPHNHIASQMKRNSILNSNIKNLKIDIPTKKKRVVDSFVLSPIPMIPPKATKRSITPSVAENVILAILRNLESLDDLIAMAVVNRGFYRVFKRHELDLMKAALRKQSPAAWEHREICYPGHDVQTHEDLEVPMTRGEYTPTSYLQFYTRDMYIIAAIKSLIKDNCESVRAEISNALTSNDPAESARVDDALWRIWTFCKIFGCGKSREGDLVAQMDWLRGGVLVHQQTASFNILTTDAFDMNDTLANAPECFALGNEGGLSAEQLFDMMELWSCLGVLLQPFEGRTMQAREYGIYEETEVRGGDIDGEEMMLVLDLAAPCRQSDPSAFILAQQNGWVDWQPPVAGGTRREFLKEAATRVYEDMIATTYAENSHKEVQRQMSKQRIQRHITELRRRKNSNERIPESHSNQEQDLSEWSSVLNNLSRPPPTLTLGSNLVSHVPSLRASPSNPQLNALPEHPTLRDLPPGRPSSPPRRIVAQPLLPSPPPSTAPSVSGDHRRSIASSMPSIEEHPVFRNLPTSIPEVPSLEDHPAFRANYRQPRTPSIASSSTPSQRSGHSNGFQQHQIQHDVFNSNAAENTADKAIFQITEMGFTAEQARYALRITDMGDGLSVTRAVNLLIREQN